MDRNAEFRRRLDKRLNASSKKGHFVGKQGFDPTPYIDIVMEKTYFEDAEDNEDIEDLMEEIVTNPNLDFIFGLSSLLNPAQKVKTTQGVLQRIVAYLEFDPQPHATFLLGMSEGSEFYHYADVDEDGELDFSPYFAQHDFTKEQKELIEDAFYEHKTALSEAAKAQTEQPITKGQMILITAFLILVVIAPPFFIPNLLQRIGWLPQDAGWFLKIIIGIVSCVVLFMILLKVTEFRAARALRKRNNR